MDVTQTLLPGVGIRYEFVTRRGQHLGLLVLRDGHSELLAYAADDPDACETLAVLEEDETEVLADLMGAPRIVEKLADLSREVPGLESQKVEVGADSPYAGRKLGSTKCRTRTGTSIVAIVRGEEVVVAPGPSEILQVGDQLVVIGSRRGLDALRVLIASGA